MFRGKQIPGRCVIADTLVYTHTMATLSFKFAGAMKYDIQEQNVGIGLSIQRLSCVPGLHYAVYRK